MLLQMALFHSFLWLSNIPLHICTTSPLSIYTGVLLNDFTLVSSFLWSLPYSGWMQPGEGCALWIFLWPGCLLSSDLSPASWTCSLKLAALWMQYLLITLSLQNLDALHDHLATIYPGMRAPSFRCTDAEKGKGLILHYYSEREGLQDIVIGIIKTVAQQIHGTEIDMKVMVSKGDASEHRWHAQYEKGCAEFAFSQHCSWTSAEVYISCNSGNKGNLLYLALECMHYTGYFFLAGADFSF